MHCETRGGVQFADRSPLTNHHRTGRRAYDVVSSSPQSSEEPRSRTPPYDQQIRRNATGDRGYSSLMTIGFQPDSRLGTCGSLQSADVLLGPSPSRRSQIRGVAGTERLGESDT